MGTTTDMTLISALIITQFLRETGEKKKENEAHTELGETGAIGSVLRGR